jgi:putative ABC transport system permease protein
LLIAGEVAIALIIVASAWLMVQSLREMTGVELGFDPSNVLTLRMLLPAAKYDPPRAMNFFNTATEKIASLPGVQNVALATSIPLSNSMLVRFDREDTTRDEAQQPSAPYASVAVDYFKTLKIPLKQGRYFTNADTADSKLVTIVSEAIATRYFPNQDPIGRQLLAYRPIRGGEQMVKLEIVGVVGNLNVSNLSVDPRPMIYAPYVQNPFGRGVQFAIRTSGNPTALASAVRRELSALDPEQPVEQLGSLETNLAAQFAPPRFQTRLMGSFAALALFLAALGIYGVNAYAVAQRRNEIGIRMALGASRMDVLRQVVGQAMLPMGVGIALGIVGTLLLAQWLKSFLIGAGKPDVLAFVGAAGALAVVAAIACYFPARKAIQIDPAITLRSE